MPPRRPPDAADDPVRQYLRAIATKGGKVGGKARWKGVPPAERSRQMRAVRAQALVKKKPGR